MIDRDIVEYIAHLARIEISDQENVFFQPQLSRILEYINKLNELSLDDVEPTKEPFVRENVLRRDVVQRSPVSGDILRNAPSVLENHFKIPKVIG